MSIFTIAVTTLGANGSATGTTTYTPPVQRATIEGFLTAIKLDFATTAPASTVVTVKEVGGLGRTLLTAPAGYTDVVYYPTVPEENAVGGATGGRMYPYLECTGIEVTVTLSNALTPVVTVELFVN
jgi:hypothetical protein